MDPEVSVRASLATIHGDVDKITLQKLTFIHIKEAGEREKIKNFFDLVVKLEQRDPVGYLQSLKASCEEIQRNDIVKKLDNLISLSPQSQCFFRTRSKSARATLTNCANLSFQKHLEIKDDERSHSNYSLSSEGDSSDFSGEADYRSCLVTRLSENSLKRFQAIQSDFELRNYQLELAQPSIAGQNVIICSPTGSGKTVTAGYVCKKLIERDPGVRIVFLVPIRSLSNQQSEMLTIILDEPVMSNPDVPLKELLNRCHAVVVTHQVLLNELESKSIDLQDIDFIVFDECHHTKLEHPYNKIMNIYHRKKLQNKNYKLPQILGMTASLGTNNSNVESQILFHFATLCARLDSRIKVIQDENNKEELLEHNSKPTKDQIITCVPRLKPHFYLKLSELMCEMETENQFQSMPIRGSQAYRNEIIKMRKAYEEMKETMNEIFVCKALEKLNEALLLFNDTTEEYAIATLRIDLEFLYGAEKQMELLLKIETVVKHLETVCCYDEAWSNNEKLVKLCHLLENMSGQYATCVIIARTCRIVDFLYNFLEGHKDLKEKLHCLNILGQSNEEHGMTESQQIQTISTFKNIAGTKCSVLIGTDVVQEGMDYPKCNSVIRYNFVSNEIGTVQSRGRARAPDSQIFLIVDQGSINLKREIENLFRERKMLEVLDHLPDQEAKFQELLEKAKTDLYGNLESEVKKEESKTMDPNKVTLYCKTCKRIMCSGSSIKKSPSGYISMDHDSIIKNTSFCKWSNIQNYKQNQHLGNVKCLTCDQAVAVKINFKKNSNIYAYILKKKALSYKENGCMTYINIPNTWDQLPFKIENLLDSQLLQLS